MQVFQDAIVASKSFSSPVCVLLKHIEKGSEHAGGIVGMLCAGIEVAINAKA